MRALTSGEELLYWSIFREADWWECDSNFTDGSETEEQFIELLKERVDAELRENDPWGERRRG